MRACMHAHHLPARTWTWPCAGPDIWTTDPSAYLDNPPKPLLSVGSGTLAMESCIIACMNKARHLLQSGAEDFVSLSYSRLSGGCYACVAMPGAQVCACIGMGCVRGRIRSVARCTCTRSHGAPTTRAPACASRPKNNGKGTWVHVLLRVGHTEHTTIM